MAQQLSEIQQEYLRSQLHYDHRDAPPPPNTLSVHQLQHELIFRAVKQYAAAHEVHMLDVGCGWGDFSNQLDPFLKTYVGVEPSPVELARFTKRPNRFLVRGVGEYLDFLKDRSRNFILLNSVLDHCFDWRKTWDNCLRILAPGGLLVISMENSQKLIVRWRQVLGRKHVHEGHLEFFSFEGTKKMLAPDFQITDDRTIGYLVGMHTVTQKIPLPVAPLRFVNRVVNGVFRVLAPAAGHIFFISAIRNGTLPAPESFAAPFRCPQCKAALAFDAASCACGLRLHHAPEGFLDSIEGNVGLQSALGLK